MATMRVAGAGTSAANGDYTETGTRDGKPYYNKSGTSDTAHSIAWFFGFQWAIVDGSGSFYYFSTENVATPDLVTTWTANTGSNPAPTVTVAPSGPVMPIFRHHYVSQGIA